MIAGRDIGTAFGDVLSGGHGVQDFARTAVSLVQLVLLWKLARSTRATADATTRVAQLTAALELLTNTAEEGFVNVASELERLGARPLAAGSTRRATTRRIAAAARKGRPLFLVDIAVPRDIDPAVNKLDEMFVYDIDDEPGVLINPTITESDGEWVFEEGCLSVPGMSFEIVRPKQILVSGIDLSGNDITIEADELFSRLIQHEIDHLDGVLFVDRISTLKRGMFRRWFKKNNRLAGEQA